jgi:ABC-2 type transport system ATP-binding protein
MTETSRPGSTVPDPAAATRSEERAQRSAAPGDAAATRSEERAQRSAAPGDAAAGNNRDGWPAVVVRGLVKRFDSKVAVDHIDLDVPRGCFYGLVGPNGAGKTTSIRMMTALLRPDGGQVWVEGRDVWADAVQVKAHIGVLPDEFKLFDRLTGEELLNYCGLLRGMAPDLVAERTRDLLDVLDLTGAADMLVIDYSTGMRKKVALAAALLHGPAVLFLDEPFEAVDPVSTRAIRSVLERFTDAGNTVVFSSHVMEVVERICDRVAVVNRGRVIAEGAIDDLRGGRRLEDVFVELVGARDAGADALSWLDGPATADRTVMRDRTATSERTATRDRGASDPEPFVAVAPPARSAPPTMPLGPPERPAGPPYAPDRPGDPHDPRGPRDPGAGTP